MAEILNFQDGKGNVADPDVKAKNEALSAFVWTCGQCGNIPYDCVPVAVDLVDGARQLPAYTHPERAFYVFGPEDGTLGERVLGKCRDKVMVPTVGCMNLAASVNVVLYDRMAKS